MCIGGVGAVFQASVMSEDSDRCVGGGGGGWGLSSRPL